jgi:hypothetical protein
LSRRSRIRWFLRLSFRNAQTPKWGKISLAIFTGFPVFQVAQYPRRIRNLKPRSIQVAVGSPLAVLPALGDEKILDDDGIALWSRKRERQGSAVRADETHGREVRAVSSRISREKAQRPHRGMGADVEVGERRAPLPATSSIPQEGLAG